MPISEAAHPRSSNRHGQARLADLAGGRRMTPLESAHHLESAAGALQRVIVAARQAAERVCLDVPASGSPVFSAAFRTKARPYRANRKRNRLHVVHVHPAAGCPHRLFNPSINHPQPLAVADGGIMVAAA